MIKKTLIFLGLLAFFFGQAQFLTLLIVGKTGVDDLKILEKENKRIVYIPTIHVEKPAYYERIKQYVDSARAEGYVIYYEGIAIEETSEEEMKMLRLKIRKLLRFNLFNTSNDDNKSVPKYYKKKKRINQADADLGIKPSVDVRADMTVNQIIRKYEEKYGSLKLTDCDYNTPLNDKYKCKDDKEFLAKVSAQYVVTDEFRNDYLIDLLLKSNHNKILVIYGEGHWLQGLWSNLFDEVYRLVKGKV